MIFLSAQPDDTYFLWQLEIQLLNFKSLKISNNNIHIIIGYNPKVGLKHEFKKLIQNNNHLAEFYIYADTRINSIYASSIRPHLLAKHWERYPRLKNETIFYHDSDILFSRIPDIISQIDDPINYVSDTTSYIASQYIIEHSNESILKQMTSIVGITDSFIRTKNDAAGGAQYILKELNKDFWQKVYVDSENIYKLLIDYNTEEQEKSALNLDYSPQKIQAWCADMWAVLWNLWYLKKEVKIHSELDFSWPTDAIENWNRKAILHYAGLHTDKQKYFYKRDYIQHAPWYDDRLNSIPSTNCSYPIVKLIKEKRKQLNNDRSNIKFKCVFDQKKQSTAIENYKEKYFTYNGTSGKIIILECPENLLLPYKVMVDIDKKLEIENFNTIVFENVYQIDQLFQEAFNKVLDAEILILNKWKFILKKDFISVKVNHKEEVACKERILNIKEEVFLL